MKDKIINFLLVFLLVFLLMNLFFPVEKNKQKTGIQISTDKTNYTIPLSLSINISNFSEENIVINPCKDIQIKKDDIIITKKTECSDIVIKQNETKTISYQNEYNLFKYTWTYLILTKIKDKEYTSSFNLENAWFFKKFFVFFFYQPIYNLMAFLLKFTSYSLWWAIVIITVIIRLLLLIPQHKMMLSQRKMQLIQPKIKEIQEKYKWNHQMLWMELMKLYKKENVNPFGSCGLLLIQMPILIVLYYVIIWIKNQSNQFYLYSFLSDYNASLIDSNFYWLDLFWIWWWAGLILAFIVWLLQFIQTKLSLSYNKINDNKNIVLEKKKWNSNYESVMPDPEIINKFMLYWLPVMIMIFTYFFFAWVGLYWGISTLFMIFQQAFVNKVLKK